MMWNRQWGDGNFLWAQAKLLSEVLQLLNSHSLECVAASLRW
jgi:hypothetical protein